MLFIPAKIISVFFSLAKKIFYSQGQSGVLSYKINKQADEMNCIGYKEGGNYFVFLAVSCVSVPVSKSNMTGGTFC